ncbi:hypothetical protein CDN99_19905 [Roseateles aquatilis]|uniref:Oxidoreductase molybdopterin-binding domain-containing protein n=1 Tax=Roseateles aquatilis TaxID=431061 RepID=A0A246J302_9BURK|nr:molybdopterin-dependent oxidoreductase [Roseateles aquatilis]OWQ86965.1 hypothetical protein CDN99_19905 [Roseateles aquatilis]
MSFPLHRTHRPSRVNWIAARVVALSLVVAGLSAWAGPRSETVRIAGAVKTPLDLTVADLRAFPPDQIASFTTMKRLDGQEVASTVRGVKLSAVIERAGVVAPGRNDWKSLIVLASATDGYKVSFSWPELINTAVGAGVLVVFERDGQPLADDQGRIALVSANDLRTGPRHVKWLDRIELRQP